VFVNALATAHLQSCQGHDDTGSDWNHVYGASVREALHRVDHYSGHRVLLSLRFLMRVSIKTNDVRAFPDLLGIFLPGSSEQA